MRFRVLIIDDDEIIALALFQHLLDRGIAVDLALDPTQAETFLRANEHALIIMDAYLTGQLHERPTELLDMVRMLRPESDILLLTAYGSAVLADRVRAYDRITVVPKPQSVAYLSELVEGFVSGPSAGRLNVSQP